MKSKTTIPQGVAWSLSSRVASQVIQFATSLALARLIAPEAFGLVGMVATVTAFLSLFIDAGFGVALVQRKDLEPSHIEGAFTLTVGVGTIVCALLLAVAPLVALFYGPAILTDVTRVSAIAVLLGSAGVVPRALLVRDMRLGTLALIDLSTAVISAAVSLGLALSGAGVWALVVSGVATGAVTLLLLVGAARWRPQFGSWRGARPLLGVGLNLLAFNAINYWARTADNILIGAWIGERELGLYLRAYGLMLLPLTEIVAVLSSAVLPALARLQHDHAAVKAAYLKAVGVVALVSLPAMVGLSLVADPFVAVLYGPNWTGVAPMLQVLAIVGAIQTIYSPVGWVYMSLGRTDLMFRWGIFATTITVASLAYGASLGSGVHVAWMYLAANVIIFVPAYLYMGRIVELRLRELGTAVLASVGGTAAMAVCVRIVDQALPGTTAAGGRLGLDAAVGIVSYVAACRLLRNRAARDAADLVVEMRPSWRRWVQPIASLLASPRNTSKAQT
jgi:O-antigen/teichoic acid export membrane protein